MIFVTVGNALQSFERLVRSVDEAIGRGDISSEVFVQRGCTSFQPRHAQSVEFLDGEAFQHQIRTAQVVVSHAGVGTILQCLRAAKVPVLVPRQKVYHEIVDDHQIEICEALERDKRVVYVRDLADLAHTIQLAADWTATPQSRQSRLHGELHKCLAALAAARGLQMPRPSLKGGTRVS